MKIVLAAIILGLVLLIDFYFLLWKNVNWGKISPIFYAERGGDGGAPIEPGSQTVSKSLTVVFGLK